MPAYERRTTPSANNTIAPPNSRVMPQRGIQLPTKGDTAANTSSGSVVSIPIVACDRPKCACNTSNNGVSIKNEARKCSVLQPNTTPCCKFILHPLIDTSIV